MCAALLHGALQQASGNKHAGPPADRDGKVITNPSAQPPCFLRYSPQLFAAEAPAWFTHDPITNRLSLRPGVPKPWMRQPHPSFQVDDPRRWLYCADCKERFFPDAGERAAHSFVTYRDRASTNYEACSAQALPGISDGARRGSITTTTTAAADSTARGRRDGRACGVWYRRGWWCR